MLYPEKLKKFDKERGAFRPYGLTCELWKPGLMQKPDRHNEIEINYLTEGSLTYLFRGSKITIPKNRLALFWGLVPHQIVSYDKSAPYYVCTIPLTQFLEWKLPGFYIDRVLKGEVLIENSRALSIYDEFLLNNWIKDLSSKNGRETVLLEMHARLIRMADKVLPKKENEGTQIHSGEISYVERIAMYIAQNYSRPIKAADIGEEVGLHPDYANVVFKKAFGMTLNGYIVQERITQAQRKLVSTDKSITDISYECGFNSLSRFNLAFKRINNCTPREFRKTFV
ncbi:MAG: transcriptional regulator [Cytophagaceae bacterium]|nr:transcriptional regulator [Cytophagaceae bacterium]